MAEFLKRSCCHGFFLVCFCFSFVCLFVFWNANDKVKSRSFLYFDLILFSNIKFYKKIDGKE